MCGVGLIFNGASECRESRAAIESGLCGVAFWEVLREGLIYNGGRGCCQKVGIWNVRGGA